MKLNEARKGVQENKWGKAIGHEFIYYGVITIERIPCHLHFIVDIP